MSFLYVMTARGITSKFLLKTKGKLHTKAIHEQNTRKKLWKKKVESWPDLCILQIAKAIRCLHLEEEIIQVNK